MKRRILIIGNSAAAIGAIEEIREHDRHVVVDVFSSEEVPAYSKPMLGHLLAGEASFEQTIYRDASFYKRNEVNLHLGRRAVSIDPSGQKVRFSDNKESGFDELILACGAVPLEVKVPGLREEDTFFLTDIEQATRLAAKAKSSRACAVLGGGFIGLCAAESLGKLGLAVTVFELSDRLVPASLDRTASDIVRHNMEKAGVCFEMGHTIAECVRGADGVRAVLSSSGRAFPAEFVVMAIGVRPNAELAAEAGLRVDKGVVVDDRMRTSHPRIYAAGDVAEAEHWLSGDLKVVPNWPNAARQGRVAGANACGVESRFSGSVEMNVFSFGGVTVGSIGLVNEAGSGAETYSLLGEGGKSYRKVVIKGGRLLGALFLGNLEKAGLIGWLMREKVDVSAWIEDLLSGEIGVSYLPRELREECLRGAGRQNATK